MNVTCCLCIPYVRFDIAIVPARSRFRRFKPDLCYRAISLYMLHYLQCTLSCSILGTERLEDIRSASSPRLGNHPRASPTQVSSVTITKPSVLSYQLIRVLEHAWPAISMTPSFNRRSSHTRWIVDQGEESRIRFKNVHRSEYASVVIPVLGYAPRP